MCNLPNYWFEVKLNFESSTSARTDKSLQICVMAIDVGQALLNAKTILKKSNSDLNFMKIWTWSVEKRRPCMYV